MTMIRMILVTAALIFNIASASPPTTIEIEDNTIYFNPCTGENVQLSGRLTIKLSFSIKNDIIHVSSQIKEHSTGVGLTTGAQYTINGEDNQESNLKLVNNTGEENAVFTANVIGNGAVPNEHLKSTLHITVNANGAVTVQRLSLTDSCQ